MCIPEERSTFGLLAKPRSHTTVTLFIEKRFLKFSRTGTNVLSQAKFPLNTSYAIGMPCASTTNARTI